MAFSTIKKRARRKTDATLRRKPKPISIKRGMWFRGHVWNSVVKNSDNLSYFPSEVCFSKNPNITLKSFQNIREKLHKNTGQKLWMKKGLNPQKTIKINSYVSMEKVTEISTSAALVLAAECPASALVSQI